MLLLCRGSALKSVRETAEFLLPPSLITIDKTSPLLLSVMASVCAMYTIRRMKSISFPSFDLPLLLLFFWMATRRKELIIRPLKNRNPNKERLRFVIVISPLGKTKTGRGWAATLMDDRVPTDMAAKVAGGGGKEKRGEPPDSLFIKRKLWATTNN